MLLISSYMLRGQRWQLAALVALFFVAGCTVQFELPPQPVITNLPDGGKVDILPDSIPAMYSGRPRFYWEQIIKSDSTYSFAVTNGKKDGHWVRGDSMRWHTSGPFITVMDDTLKTAVDSTRLTQDSILVYYQNGTILRRDTISGTGGGSDAGTDDQTLTYNGSGSLTIESGNTVDMSDLLDNTDDQVIDVFSITSNTLNLSLENDGEATKTVSLAPYLDNTDDQTIDTFSLSGTTLNLSIESDGQPAKTVDLSSLTTNETITLSGDVTGSGTTAITTTIATGAVGADELASTAVTPGSYTHASITVDADGRVTAASSGTDNTGMNTFDVIGDAGTAETVQDGDELYLRGQFGVNTSNSATDIINFEVDSSEVATVHKLQTTRYRADSLFLNVNEFYVSSWSQAAQAAIDTAAAWGGGTVVFPERSGVYEMDSVGTYGNYGAGHHYCVELKDNVSLVINDTLRLRSNLTTDAVKVEMFQGHKIHNLKITGTGVIDMNNSNQPGFTTGYGQDDYAGIYIHQDADTVRLQNGNIEISGLKIINSYGNPYFVKGVEKLVTRDLYFTNVGECGHVGVSNNVLVDNIYCDGATTTGDGVEITSSDNVIVTNCTVKNKGVAYEYNATGTVRMYNCHVSNSDGIINSSGVDSLFAFNTTAMNCSNNGMYLQATNSYVNGFTVIGGFNYMFQVPDESNECSIKNVHAQDVQGGLLINGACNIVADNWSFIRPTGAVMQWQAGTGDTVNIDIKNLSVDSASYRIFSTSGTAQKVNLNVLNSYWEDVQNAGGVIFGGDALTNVDISLKEIETDTLENVINTTDLRGYKQAKFVTNMTTITDGIHGQEITLIADNTTGAWLLQSYLDNASSNMVFTNRALQGYRMKEGDAIKLRYDKYTDRWTMFEQFRTDNVGLNTMVLSFVLDSIAANSTTNMNYITAGLGEEFVLPFDAKVINATCYLDGTSLNVSNSLRFKVLTDAPATVINTNSMTSGDNSELFAAHRYYPSVASGGGLISAGTAIYGQIVTTAGFTNTGQRIRLVVVIEY